MNRRSIWTVSVRTKPDLEEAVAEWLEQTFNRTPVSYTAARTGITKVSVYLPKKPGWTLAERERFRAELGACLKSRSRRGKEADGCARLPGNPPLPPCGIGGYKFSLARISSEKW